MTSPADNDTAKPSNFLRQVIERDLEQGTYAGRHLGGTPGDAAHHAAGHARPGADPHALSARAQRLPAHRPRQEHLPQFRPGAASTAACATCASTTPTRRRKSRSTSTRILDAVQWLGFDWDAPTAPSHLYFASDYFDFMYRAAEYLIEAGHAYVDEQSAEEMRANRGDFSTPGTDSPFRSRTPDENLARFREMRDGKLADGAAVLRAKIDMASPNINLRDPALYRITPRDAPQHRRQVVHLPDVHLRAPDRGRAGEHHPQHLHAGVRGPAAVLRLAARPPGRRRPARRSRCRGSTSSRGSTSPT